MSVAGSAASSFNASMNSCIDSKRVTREYESAFLSARQRASLKPCGCCGVMPASAASTALRGPNTRYPAIRRYNKQASENTSSAGTGSSPVSTCMLEYAGVSKPSTPGSNSCRSSICFCRTRATPKSNNIASPFGMIMILPGLTSA